MEINLKPSLKSIFQKRISFSVSNVRSCSAYQSFNLKSQDQTVHFNCYKIIFYILKRNRVFRIDKIRNLTMILWLLKWYFNLGNFKLKLWNTARLLCEKRLLEKYVSTFSANTFLWTVPQCTKFPFKKIFLGQVKPWEGGSNLTSHSKWFENV